jgi:hypothetical protein
MTMLAASGILPFSLLLLVTFITFPLGMQLLAVKAAGLKPSQLPGSRLMPSFVASMEVLNLGVVLCGLVPAAWLGNAAACMMLVVAVGLTIALHLRTYSLDPGFVPLELEEEEGVGDGQPERNIWEISGHQRDVMQQGDRAAPSGVRRALKAVPLAGGRANDSQQQPDQTLQTVQVQEAHQVVASPAVTGQLDLTPLVDLSGAAAAVQIVPTVANSPSRSGAKGNTVASSPNGKVNRPGAAVPVHPGVGRALSLGATLAAQAGGEQGGDKLHKVSNDADAVVCKEHQTPVQSHQRQNAGARDIDSCWTCGVERPLRSKHCPFCR